MNKKAAACVGGVCLRWRYISKAMGGGQRRDKNGYRAEILHTVINIIHEHASIMIKRHACTQILTVTKRLIHFITQCSILSNL